MGMGNLLREKGSPIVKYRDTLRSSVQKRLNRGADVAMAINFWFSMGYNFGCMIGVGFWGQAIR